MGQERGGGAVDRGAALQAHQRVHHIPQHPRREEGRRHQPDQVFVGGESVVNFLRCGRECRLNFCSAGLPRHSLRRHRGHHREAERQPEGGGHKDAVAVGVLGKYRLMACRSALSVGLHGRCGFSISCLGKLMYVYIS